MGQSNRPNPVTARGHCLCGAVQFELRGAPRFVAHCHCTTCRRAHGAGVVTWAGHRADELSITAGADGVVHYATETDSVRSFCNTCGTTMFFAGERWPGEVHVAVGALSDDFGGAPTAHAYADRAPAWLPIRDDLPRFGGADGNQPLGPD